MKTIKQIITVIAIAIFMLGSVNGNSQSFDDPGIQHNDFLQKILPKITTNKKSEIVSEVIKLVKFEAPKGDFSIIEGIDINTLSQPNLLLIELNKRVKIEPSLYTLLSNSINKVNQLESLDKVLSFVETEKNKNLNFSKVGQEHYMNFLSVLKHSTIFWDKENGRKYINLPNNSTYPTNGGKGGPSLSENTDYALKINWWKVALCDAVGTLAGPEGTVIASACSAINQY